jgi:DNA-binding transcriptional LysR family regulator
MTDIDQGKIAQLDGTLLLVLQELLRQRRTTRAAERLGMSQSAVSHALRRLRLLLGDPLFTRRPHGLEPTRHALDLAPKIDALLAAMADVIGLDDRFEPATSARDFGIGAPDHVSTLLAPMLVASTSRDAPNVRLAFSQHLGDEALAALRRGEIDLALGRFGSRIGADLVVDPLFEDRYCLVARAGHPRLDLPLSPETYASLDHLQISVTGDLGSLEIERFARSALPRRTVASVPRFVMAFSVVGSSDVVALAPRRLVSAYEEALGLCAHDLPFDVDPIRVVAVRRARSDQGVSWLSGLIGRCAAPTA